MSGAEASAHVDAPLPTSALRMILSLGGAGAVAGLLIVFVYEATYETIAAHEAEVLRLAVGDVLAGPARFEAYYVVGDGLGTVPAAGVSERDADRVYVGFDAGGRATGIAAQAAAPGFQDVIRLIYGFDPRSGRLLGMRVLESKETPGLGDKIEKDRAWADQFAGAEPPLAAVKRRSGAAGEVDAISGATISSRAVVRIVNASLERVRAPAVAHFREVAP